jgi:PAS domain S-box-containing protein
MTYESIVPDLLGRLPMGVVAVFDNGEVYVNIAARGIVGPVVANRMGLYASLPALAHFLDAHEIPAPQTIELGNESQRVHAIRLSGKVRAALLLPIQLLRQLQPELHRLEQFDRDFQEIFCNSFDGIFVADGEGNTLMVNAGCERNYDLSAEQMVGKNVAVFERKGYIKPVIAGRVIAERRRISAVQHTHTGKTIMVTGIPLLGDDGNVRRVIINSRDTTELLQLQEELERTRSLLRRMESEIQALRQENVKLDGVVFQSAPMQRIAAMALRVAKIDATILVTGESGVGKEVVVKLIHKKSNRISGPFIKINCGAIPRELLESELFGYESGSFTGARRQGKIGLIEAANGGTLFLDEIGELALDLQVKLLQVLQDHCFSRVGGTATIKVDIRIIAATNVDLEEMVRHKQFRSDLYYRLNVVPIHIPPLRERHDDIIPLIHLYLTDFNTQYGLPRRISERALQSMLKYGWPGNVRELRNMIERLVVTTSADLISVDDLPRQFLGDDPDDDVNVRELDAEAQKGGGSAFRERVAQFEATLVREAVELLGTTRAAARHLGVSQATVVRKQKLLPPATRSDTIAPALLSLKPHSDPSSRK